MKRRQTKRAQHSSLLTKPRANVVPIETRILVLRQQKVILDTALAEICGVPVKRLNQQVNRNRQRFPSDFMFRLKGREFANLRLQFATSRRQHGGRRSLPFAFTEHGVVMAATVLNSEQAEAMSVYVVRAFVRLREALAANKEIAAKLAELEEHLETHDGAIQEIMNVLKRLLNPRPRHTSKIGFRTPLTSDPAISMRRLLARS